MNVCRLLGVVGSADFHQAKHALEVSHKGINYDYKIHKLYHFFGHVRFSVVSIQSSLCLEMSSVSL